MRDLKRDRELPSEKQRDKWNATAKETERDKERQRQRKR